MGEQLRALYDQVRARQGGIGAAALVGNTCQGCRVSFSPVELAAIRKQPPEAIKRCENRRCARILVSTDPGNKGRRREAQVSDPVGGRGRTDGAVGQPGCGRLRARW